jgi:hypothetical protein
VNEGMENIKKKRLAVAPMMEWGNEGLEAI